MVVTCEDVYDMVREREREGRERERERERETPHLLLVGPPLLSVVPSSL